MVKPVKEETEKLEEETRYSPTCPRILQHCMNIIFFFSGWQNTSNDPVMKTKYKLKNTYWIQRLHSNVSLLIWRTVSYCSLEQELDTGSNLQALNAYKRQTNNVTFSLNINMIKANLNVLYNTCQRGCPCAPDLSGVFDISACWKKRAELFYKSFLNVFPT